MKKYLFSFTLMLLCLLPAARVRAEELTPEITCSGKQKAASMTDGSYDTAAKFAAGDTVAITAAGGEKIQAVYIQWDARVTPYTMTADSQTLSCGTDGFLHEYIPLDAPAETLTIQIPANKMKICNLRIFDSKEIPSDVQVWSPPCDRADIILIPSHADDELLYMGGIIPSYGAECGAKVQVVYMTEFWSSSQDVREHEKLDGLWTDGCRIYPVCLNYRDKYAKDLEAASGIYDYDDMVNQLTDTLRRFQPQIVVTHDFKGEYGHGFHILTANAVTEALDKAADPSFRNDTEIFTQKGVWDTPKAYFHLYAQNAITMNLRVPLKSMNGMTALEAAIAGYDKHISQHKWSFKVSDDYKYSCAKFGLYRTSVGVDTENSMLEHIILYAEQERLEEERLEQERLEQERLESERAESERAESERAEEERLKQEQEKQKHDQELLQMQQELKKAQASLRRTVILTICLIAVMLVLTIVLIVLAVRGKHRETP